MPEKIHSFTKDKQCHGEGKLILSRQFYFPKIEAYEIRRTSEYKQM